MDVNRPKISVVLITLNEAENLQRSLPPLAQVTDDIVVVDSGSNDGTVELCNRYGATVVERKWEGYANAKNFGNSLARHQWVLSVDADEVLSDDLVQTIKTLVLEEGSVYALDRITNYCGTWIRHSGWYPDWKVRLFDKSVVEWSGDYVHERLIFPDGTTVQRLKGKLYHWSYTSPEDHLRRMEQYARLSAQELFANGKRVSPVLRWLSPFARFIRTYIVKAGLLDGKEGWTISVRNAQMVRMKYRFLTELVREGKKA